MLLTASRYNEGVHNILLLYLLLTVCSYRKGVANTISSNTYYLQLLLIVKAYATSFCNTSYLPLLDTFSSKHFHNTSLPITFSSLSYLSLNASLFCDCENPCLTFSCYTLDLLLFVVMRACLTFSCHALFYSLLLVIVRTNPTLFSSHTYC